MLAVRSLAWLTSERIYKQLTKTDADTFRTEVRNPYGRVRGGTEGAERNCNPIGRTSVSTKLDTSELPETK